MEALVENLKRDLALGGATVSGDFLNVEAKTSSYTVVMPADSGKLLTTTGASGAVTFTLPTPAASIKGAHIYLFNTVDQNMVVGCATNDKIVTLNDAAADSVTFSTSSEKIGAAVHAVCDGSLWLVMDKSENSITSTIAT
jgi:hypothetical protein